MSDHSVKRRKKLIEVLMPLEAINDEAIHRKSKSPKGFPSALHKWWSPKPLASSRAVLFAQLVDDPSSIPEEFPDEKSQDEERKRLLRILQEIVRWDNTQNELLRSQALLEIRKTWERACRDQADTDCQSELLNPNVLPTAWDPFSGSGSIPVSAQWLGIPTIATDLNPVSAVINKAVIEYPYQHRNSKPLFDASSSTGLGLASGCCEGLLKDIDFFSNILLKNCWAALKDNYPAYEIDEALVAERPDLAHLQGQSLICTAWIWARTVESPSPAFKGWMTPLATSFLLSSKPGKEAYCSPVYEGNKLVFDVHYGKPENLAKVKRGSSAGKRSAFICQASGDPVTYEYIRGQGQKGRIGSSMMAVVAQAKNGRVYLPARDIDIQAATMSKPSWRPSLSIPDNPRDFKTPLYGMSTFGDLFTDRQLSAYCEFTSQLDAIFSSAVSATGAVNSEVPSASSSLSSSDLKSYINAVKVYLGIVIDRMVYYGTNLSGWLPKDSALRDCMPRQALAMTWEYAEANPFGKSSGDFKTCLRIIRDFLEAATPNSRGSAYAAPAQTFAPQAPENALIISTDPPYYDNICYSELADFFYVWQKRMFADVFPGYFDTIASPKAEELLASQYRYGSKDVANQAFLYGMTEALSNLAKRSSPMYPITLYYAFKQTEDVGDGGQVSTGWESFLESILSAGLSITATWPLRTEKEGRLLASGTNALASCVVLVCRKKEESAPVLSRVDFRRLLKQELPSKLYKFEDASIAPVDIAQAAIGPGMEIFSSAKMVLEVNDRPMTVRSALAEINNALDEYLAHDDNELDSETRFAVTFFESFGYRERSFGDAEGLARARNISVDGVVRSGILRATAGKVQLLCREQLDPEWDPLRDEKLCAWEATQHLIKRLEERGESAAASLLIRLQRVPSHFDLTVSCLALAYRLYNHCEKTKQAEEARAYNGLVIAWPELERLAAAESTETAVQASLI